MRKFVSVWFGKYRSTLKLILAAIPTEVTTNLRNTRVRSCFDKNCGWINVAPLNLQDEIEDETLKAGEAEDPCSAANDDTHQVPDVGNGLQRTSIQR